MWKDKYIYTEILKRWYAMLRFPQYTKWQIDQRKEVIRSNNTVIINIVLILVLLLFIIYYAFRYLFVRVLCLASLNDWRHWRIIKRTTHFETNKLTKTFRLASVTTFIKGNNDSEDTNSRVLTKKLYAFYDNLRIHITVAH